MSSTNTLKILHLSDLHFNSSIGKVQKTERDKILNSLIEFLKKDIVSNNYSFDYLFITGDVAFKGSEDDYSEALEFVNKIKAELQISDNSVIVTHGNHDCYHEHASIRQDIRDLTTKHFKGGQLTNDEIKTLRDFNISSLETGKCSELYSTVNATKYGNYNEFCRKLKVSNPINLIKKDNIFVSSVFVRNDVTVFCVDSSLNAISGRIDNGNLYLPAEPTKACVQVVEELNKKGKKLNITLMHQPPSWLHWSNLFAFPNVKPIFHAVLAASDVILCGHVHNNNIGFPDYILAEKPIVYGGTLYSDEKEIGGWFSINIITIDDENNSFSLRCIMKEEYTESDVIWVEKIAQKTYPLNIKKDTSKIDDLKLEILSLEHDNKEKDESMKNLKDENQYLLNQLLKKK